MKNHKSKFLFIITTVDNLNNARQMAQLLVNDKKAACVSISSPVQSIYRWQDHIETEEEYMLFIKSTAHNFSEIKNLILAHHDYEVPEIIAIPIVEGEKNYLNWLCKNTLKEDNIVG